MGFLAAFSAVTAFFGSTLGRIVGIGVIALAVYAAGELRGRRVATDACRVAAQKAKDAAKTQDQVAQDEVNTGNDATADMLQKQKEKSDATIAQLQLELNSRPLTAPCLYGAGGKPASVVRPQSNASGGTGDAKPAPAPVVLAPRRNPPSN